MVILKASDLCHWLYCCCVELACWRGRPEEHAELYSPCLVQGMLVQIAHTVPSKGCEQVELEIPIQLDS